MDGSTHFGILRPQNTCFRGKIGHRMKNTASAIILWQENEPGELYFRPEAGQRSLQNVGGAAELAERSQRSHRRYLPSASASSGGGSRCCPRISSWRMHLSGWKKNGRRSRRSFLPSRLRGALVKALLACLRKTSWKPHRSGQQREEFISRPPAGDLDGLLLPSEDKLSEGAGTPCQPKKRNGYLQPAKRALPDGSLCPARITARYLLAV